MNVNELKTICDALQGQIPVAKTQQDYEQLYVNVQAAFSAQIADENKSRKCASSTRNDLKFWLGQKRVKGEWYDPYDNVTLTWDVQAYGSTDNSDFDVLVAQSPKSIEASKSLSDTSCGICMGINLDNSRRLQLKGMCRNELDQDAFDVYYYVDGLKNGRLHFK